MQNPCPPPLSTIICCSTALYMGGSTVGAASSLAACSTSTDGVWWARRWDRIRAMLDFDDEDDEGEVRREFQWMGELGRAEEDEQDEHDVQPGRRDRPLNAVIDDECGLEEMAR